MPGSSLLISLDSSIRQNHDLFRVTLGTLRVVSDAGHISNRGKWISQTFTVR
jgi:hypothetical protein